MKRDDPNQTGEDCNSVTGSESVEDTLKSESSPPSCLEDCRQVSRADDTQDRYREAPATSENKKVLAKVRFQMRRLKQLPVVLAGKLKKKIDDLPKPQDLPCLNSSAETVSATEPNSKRKRIQVFSRSLLQKFRRTKFVKNEQSEAKKD